MDKYFIRIIVVRGKKNYIVKKYIVWRDIEVYHKAQHSSFKDFFLTPPLSTIFKRRAQ